MNVSSGKAMEVKIMVKELSWLVGELDRRNYKVADPKKHVHDGQKRFLLVSDVSKGFARWLAKNKPLAQNVADDETAYYCPDELWYEFNFTLT